MRLISILDVADTVHDEKVFHTSCVGDFIISSIFFIALSAITVYYVWHIIYLSVPFWGHLVYLWFAFWTGLFALLIGLRFKDSLLPSNWLLRLSPEHILIKFRSFQNYHYPETDLVVIDLSWRDIDWVRKTKETSHKDHGDSALTEFFTYLDIKLCLSDEEIKLIEQELNEERKRKPPRSDLDKLYHELMVARREKKPDYEIKDLKDRIRQEKQNKRAEKNKSGSKNHDYPVRLVHDNILRVRWNRVKPNIKKTLAVFSERITIDDEIRIVTDSRSNQNELSGKKLEDMILERIAKGDKFDAMALAKKHYGYSTTEAKQFVDELINEQPSK